MRDSVAPRTYFPGLNALRAIAATSVVIGHVEQMKSLSGFQNIYANRTILSLGPAGVDLFFSISGFLITFLLLEERDTFGNISISSFYLRRSRRILPLYFLVIIIGFVFVPLLGGALGGEHGTRGMIASFLKALMPNYGRILGLYLCMFPNVALYTYGPVLCAAQTWSLGYEEHFYAIWPWLLRACQRWLPLACIALIAGKCVTEISLEGSGHGPVTVLLGTYLNNFRFEYMGFGAIAACILHRHKARRQGPLSRIFVNLPMQFLAVPLILLFLCFGGSLTRFHSHVCAAISALLIVNVSQGGRWLRWLEARPVNVLGRISYGLYMLHPLVILVVLLSVEAIGLRGLRPSVLNTVILAASMALSVWVSLLSHRHFESGWYVRRRAHEVD